MDLKWWTAGKALVLACKDISNHDGIAIDLYIDSIFSVALVRSAIMCIRGACSQMHSPVFNAPMHVQIAEARL